jgi:hypothetical protein
MQLDVQQTGCPILRLHDFDQEELRCLRVDLNQLSNRERLEVVLHNEPYVQSTGGCRLTLRVGTEDRGIEHSIDPNLFGWVNEPGTWDPYVCELTPSGWAHVAHGVDLLLQLRFLCNEHVWLHKQWDGRGAVAWLLSPTGDW